MFFLYLLIFIAVFVLTIFFRNYKRKLLPKDKRLRDGLYIFYGFSFFMLDVTKKICSRVKKSNQSMPFSKTLKKASMLYPDKNPDRYCYLLLSKRVSICICQVLLLSFLGIVYCLYTSLNTDTGITSLDRPTDGSSSKTYTLEVDNGETSQTVEIDVSKKMYEYSEIISIFDKYRSELLETMLGKNESLDYITSKLCFPDSIGNENIALRWQPEDLTLIDLSGNIIAKNIPADGAVTSINVSMTLQEVDVNLVIGVTLFPCDVTDSLSLKENIENIITQNNSDSSNTVMLPSNINGNNVTYHKAANSNPSIFFIMLLIFGIVCLIFGNKDLDKAISKRNEQLLRDYPDITSKLLLLLNAGLTIKGAIKKIVDDYKINKTDFRYAYEELSITLNSLENGVSETFAYLDYGRRCGLIEYIKLGSLLEQNLSKGSVELSFLLNEEVQNAFKNHKAYIITKSKQAETKLVFPMIIILAIIMALIMIPSFVNM